MDKNFCNSLGNLVFPGIFEIALSLNFFSGRGNAERLKTLVHTAVCTFEALKYK